jgi:pyridoxal 5'-phosphate synthase pdxT subunit
MGSPVRIGVLALQGDVAEHALALAEAGAEVVRVLHAADLAGLDGLVIPGGESTTIGKLVVEHGLVEPIRAMGRSGRPLWGTCAGMILLADRADGPQPAVGGLDVTVLRNAFGRQVQSFEADLPLRGIDGAATFRAVFIRAPAVTTVGQGVEVLAALAPDRIVAVRQGHILATAFHPELTDDRRVHRLFLSLAGGAAPRRAGRRRRPGQEGAADGSQAQRAARKQEGVD